MYIAHSEGWEVEQHHTLARLHGKSGWQSPASVTGWNDANQRDAAADTHSLPKGPALGGLRSGKTQ